MGPGAYQTTSKYKCQEKITAKTYLGLQSESHFWFLSRLPRNHYIKQTAVHLNL